MFIDEPITAAQERIFLLCILKQRHLNVIEYERRLVFPGEYGPWSVKSGPGSIAAAAAGKSAGPGPPRPTESESVFSQDPQMTRLRIQV